MKLVDRALVGLAGLMLAATSPFAQVIDYTATNLGGNTWQYNYTITNTSPSLFFDEVTIYFGIGTFAELSNGTAPANWDPLVIQPDSVLQSDGFFDVLSLDGPLAPGSSAGGFTVDFSFLGSGAPGSQRFDLIDSGSFAVVGSGATIQSLVTPVPEPSTYALMGVGLTLLMAHGLRRKRKLAIRDQVKNALGDAVAVTT